LWIGRRRARCQQVSGCRAASSQWKG
jgi:hypothetical protein